LKPDQSPSLEWKDGVPVATRFDDPYYSLGHGLEETRHVFLGGNDLPARFAPGFHIAELGFGTGLNLAASMLEWAARGVEGPLTFTSFEAFPMAVADMERALATFPEALDVMSPVLAALASGAVAVETSMVRFRLILGDARETLPAWDAQADAWFLDGFAPAKNPELWEETLLAAVGEHTTPGGTAATYSAAGAVRRALAAAGFDVSRVPGYGRKRHMSVARRP
jgi:tRNA U34 5-methylaminomethyl-2-thiouridine-forming methyltransferase MnmC